MKILITVLLLVRGVLPAAVLSNLHPRCHALADGSEFCEYRDACVTHTTLDLILPEKSPTVLPRDSNIGFATSPAYSQAAATATWMRNMTALLLGRDEFAGIARNNPFHFAMRAVLGFTVRQRLGVHFDVVMVPWTGAPPSPWCRGLLEVLFGVSATLIFGSSEAQKDSSIVCYEQLFISGQSYDVIGGVADAQQLREAAVERFPRISFQQQHLTLILRENFNGRSFLNEGELLVMAEQRADAAGLELKVVRDGDWNSSTPFEEQLRVLSTTAVLIAPHGAALTNALFLPPESAVIEVFGARAAGIRYFERLATNAGHFYFRYMATADESFPNYAAQFSGWSSRACIQDVRCRIPSKDADVRADVGRLRGMVSEALDLVVDRKESLLPPSTKAQFVAGKYVFHSYETAEEVRFREPPSTAAAATFGENDLSIVLQIDGKDESIFFPANASDSQLLFLAQQFVESHNNLSGEGCSGESCVEVELVEAMRAVRHEDDSRKKEATRTVVQTEDEASEGEGKANCSNYPATTLGPPRYPATMEYRGAATLLLHARVDITGGVVVQGDALAIEDDVAPWSVGRLASEQCRRSFCSPRSMAVSRAQTPLPSSACAPGLSVLVTHSKHLGMSYSDAMSDFARQLMTYLLLEEITTPPRLLLPDWWPRHCDPYNSGAVNWHLGSAVGDMDAISCPPLAAWIHVVLRAAFGEAVFHTSASHSTFGPHVASPSGEPLCFEQLLVLSDHDRNGQMLSEEQRRRTLWAIANAGLAAAGLGNAEEVEFSYLEYTKRAEERYGSVRNISDSTALVYGRRDVPRRRMAQYSVDRLARSVEETYYYKAGKKGQKSSATACEGKAAHFREVLVVPSFTDLTFGDQIRLFHRADVVILPRGASSVNAVFLRPGSLIIEIMHPCRFNDWQVWRLAHDRGVQSVEFVGGTVTVDNKAWTSKESCENADFTMRDDDAIEYVVRLAGCRGMRKRTEGSDQEFYGCAKVCYYPPE